MSQSLLRLWVVTVIILTTAVRINSQVPEHPDVFEKGTIPEQLKYLEEHTRIYENFRAIREDMFRSISRNTMDTLKKSKNKITGLILQTAKLDSRIDSIKKSLEATNLELKEMTRTKDGIRVLGITVNKKTYNGTVWTIIGILVFLLLTGFLLFRQNRAITVRTKKDLNDLKEEFEKYRTKTRLERERMSIDHFNEIKKLKGR